MEFDPVLRPIDLAADLAFLVMELTEAGREDLARVLVTEYRDTGGDDGGDALAGFYAAYRALGPRQGRLPARRASSPKGAARRHELEHARRLTELAERLSWRARRPMLMVVCGAAASGKTPPRRWLAERQASTHLNSDVVRKGLAGLPPRAARPRRTPTPRRRACRTYRELGARAAAALPDGGALVDATFRRRVHREAFAAGYGDAGPAPIFVECRAPAAVVPSERIAAGAIQVRPLTRPPRSPPASSRSSSRSTRSTRTGT